MPNPMVGVAAASMASSMIGSQQQKKAAGRATQASQEANEASIGEQRRQFDTTMEILNPYVKQGQYTLFGMPERSFDIEGLQKKYDQSLADFEAFKQSNPQYTTAPGTVNGSTWGGRRGRGISSIIQRQASMIENPEYARRAYEVGQLKAQLDDEIAAKAEYDQFAPSFEGSTGVLDFIKAGNQAFQEQRALAGLGSPEEEQAAIDRIIAKPQFQQQMDLGEEAILQNAAATGGVRGGNTQSALMQFRPQLLSQSISDRYNQLGGLAGTGLSTAMNLGQLGQASAANQASASQNTGANISGLLQSQGATNANAALVRGQANAAPFNMMAQLGGMYLGSKF